MLHTLRHRRKHLKKTTQLSLARLVVSFGLAGVDTVWAVYFNSFGLSESMIGFITSALIIISIATAMYSPRILEKVKETKILMISLLLGVLGYLIIAFIPSLTVFLFGAALVTVVSVFRYSSFDIIFRDEAKDSELNEDIGLMYALLNVGWFLGPLLAGFIMANYGYNSVFIVAAMFLVVAAIMISVVPIRLPRKKRDHIDTNMLGNVKSYFSEKRLQLPYIMAAGLEVWWAFIYIYVPLFMINEGIGLETLGLFLGLVTLPLMLLGYPVGKISEKAGFRIFFFSGYVIAAISALAAFIAQDINTILIILVLASVGMAFIEPLQDSFFFRQVSSLEEERFYPIYSTSADVGSFFGRIIIAIALLIIPANFSYLVVAAMMVAFALAAIRIKDRITPSSEL